jgi:hypothetical protein
MEYLYEVFVRGRRNTCTTNFVEAEKDFMECLKTHVDAGLELRVYKSMTPNILYARLDNENDVAGWRVMLEQKVAWKPHDNLLEDSPPSTPFVPVEDIYTSAAKAIPGTIGNSKIDHINPSHYQAYFGGMDLEELQWLEAKQYQNHWRNPENFKAAVLLQADKYLSRLGGKDEDSQEILKGVWYLKFLAAYIKNGNQPIRVKDIDKILGS